MPLAKEFHCVYECRANVRPLLFPHHLAQPSVHTSTTRSSLLFLLSSLDCDFLHSHQSPALTLRSSQHVFTGHPHWVLDQGPSQEWGAGCCGSRSFGRGLPWAWWVSFPSVRKLLSWVTAQEWLVSATPQRLEVGSGERLAGAPRVRATVLPLFSDHFIYICWLFFLLLSVYVLNLLKGNILFRLGDPEELTSQNGHRFSAPSAQAAVRIRWL